MQDGGGGDVTHTVYVALTGLGVVPEAGDGDSIVYSLV